MIAVAAIGWLDLTTGPDFGLSLFLAVPVFIAADRAGPRLGAIVAASSVGAWVVARVLGGGQTASTALVVWNASVRAALFAALLALAVAKRRLSDERHAASTDMLTGIANRRALSDAFLRERARVLRSKRPLTVVYIDCDDFKHINDRFGHECGNDLLRTVAATLVSGIRAVDLAARIGGDEFAVMLVDSDPQHARAILDRMRSTLRSTMVQRGWSVTFSIGAVTMDNPPATSDEAFQLADRLMYRAKHSGKDAIVHEILLEPTPIVPEREAASN